jgi:hypothetical protein
VEAAKQGTHAKPDRNSIVAAVDGGGDDYDDDIQQKKKRPQQSWTNFQEASEASESWVMKMMKRTMWKWQLYQSQSKSFSNVCERMKMWMVRRLFEGRVGGKSFGRAVAADGDDG